MNECSRSPGVSRQAGRETILHLSGANYAVRSTSFIQGNQDSVRALRTERRRALTQKGRRGRSNRRTDLWLLLALIEAPGEIVGKNELIAKVWPDVIVEEGSLRVHMSALPKALGDGQLGRQTYIANVKGRGYCFVAPITRQTQDNDPSN